MTMTCEHLDGLLPAYLEGDLGAAEHQAVEAHLHECLRCASLVRDLERIRAGAASLPALEPSRDLWDGIAARIATPVIEMPPRHVRMPARRSWQLAAAAVVLVAASSGITYFLATAGGPATLASGAAGQVPTGAVANGPDVVVPTRPRGSASPVLVRAEPFAPEVMYDQEITRLRVILDERRGNLDSATVTAVEKSLTAIDLAIAEARAALAADAQSRFLNDQLNRALEKKVGLLRRVALMPLGAS